MRSGLDKHKYLIALAESLFTDVRIMLAAPQFEGTANFRFFIVKTPGIKPPGHLCYYTHTVILDNPSEISMQDFLDSLIYCNCQNCRVGIVKRSLAGNHPHSGFKDFVDSWRKHFYNDN